MKKLIALVVLLCGFMPVLWAADGCDQHLSREEFRNKQNDESWSLMRRGKDDKTTEAQYEEIVAKVCDNRIAADRLDKSYLDRFKKILSNKKIFLVQRAEMRFHREMLKGMNRKDGGNDPKRKK